MGVACLEFHGENFRRWLKNRKICEGFLPRKFPTIRYSAIEQVLIPREAPMHGIFMGSM